MNVFARFALLCCLIGATAVALPKNFQHKHKEAFSEFKSSYKKQYASAVEELMRFQIFADNLDKINKFNAEQAPKATYTLGINHFSDMLSSELSSLNGPRMPDLILKNDEDASRYFESVLARNVSDPYDLDWRNKSGRVSKVKNQGNCISDYAFATIGILEGQGKTHKAENNDDEPASLVELSAQELVDCTEHNLGCLGGNVKETLEDIAYLGGVEREADYPYVALNKKCRFDRSKIVASNKGGYVMKEKDEDLMRKVVSNYGPISVEIYASDFHFRHYKGGIFQDISYWQDYSNHVMLIVGYGSEELGYGNYEEYWLVKNSWGPEWGDKGYIKIARNRNNTCSIANVPTIATF